jgi:signal transduction histidine kinase/DNA-binding response OmpR family regulator
MFHWVDKLHFKLGSRIFTGFGVVLAIFTAQALITNLGFDAAVDNFQRFGSLNAEAEAILEIERNALDLQRSVLAFSYTGYEGMLSPIRRLQRTLKEQAARVLASTGDTARQDRLQRMIAHFESYARDFETAVEDRRLHDQLLERTESVLGESLSRELAQGVEQASARRDFETAAAIGVALENLLLARQNALHFLNTPDSSLVRAANERLNNFAAILGRLQARLDDPDLGGRLNEVARRVPEYENSFLGLVQATRGYLHMVNVVLAGEAAEIARLTSELKQLTLDQQSLVVRRMEEHTALSQGLSRLASLLAILVGLLSAWAITRNIAGPITAMTRALTELARGDKEIQIPGRGRRDEIGAMAIAADVFKGKADELENASRYKSEFLANMSHELRTPLNSMLVLSKIFAANGEGNLSRDQVESARIIYESGQDLLHLINDVLDLSKVEAGRMEVVPENRAVTEFAAAIERQFRHIASAKGLEFTVTVAESARRPVCSDWGKIEQIIRNLLSNAFKFTERGGVRVHIGPPPRGSTYMDTELFHADLLAIAVTDTGIGIPENKREQIFEAFRQVDGTTSRKYGGTGLGLSISRNFAKLIGGELQVASRLGQGSTFTLYVPADRYTESVVAPEDADRDGNLPPDAAEFFRTHAVDVLMVDDDPRNLFAIGQILQPRVRSLHTAQDGREALAKLEQCPDIGIVLMDVMMPNMDGYEATRAIRAQPRRHDLPIIALTARALYGDREKCLEAGANDYLAKPVNPEQLLAVMAVWLDRTRLPRLAEAGPQPVPPAASSAARAEPPAPAVPLLIGGRRATVLIVDHDMRNTFSLARELQSHAGAVVMASDGRKALALMEQRTDIDILLLAAQLPDLDGAATIREIRGRDIWQRLPIIALAGEADSGAARRCLEAGADDCVVQPTATEALLDRMQALLDKTGADHD